MWGGAAASKGCPNLVLVFFTFLSFLCSSVQNFGAPKREERGRDVCRTAPLRHSVLVGFECSALQEEETKRCDTARADARTLAAERETIFGKGIECSVSNGLRWETTKPDPFVPAQDPVEELTKKYPPGLPPITTSTRY